MKKRSALLATVLAAAVVTCSMPLTAAAADTAAPYVESDTTMNFMVEQGKTYTFKMTVHGTHANPNIAMGNGAVFQTRDVKKTVENGNDVYYFKVLATGKEGEATGVYTTLPGQQPVKHAVAAIPYVAKARYGSDFTTYKVGKDIAPGEYVLTPMLIDSASNAYWGLYQVNNADGTSYNNGQFDGKNARYYVTLKEGQTLELEDIRMVAVQNAVRALPDENGNYDPGSVDYGTMYKCGFDLKPGTYTVVYDANPNSTYNTTSYAGIYNSSDFTKFDKPVFSVTFTSGTRQITLENGQYLVLGKAYLETN